MQGDSVYEFVLQLEISPNALVLILPFKVKKKVFYRGFQRLQTLTFH